MSNFDIYAFGQHLDQLGLLDADGGANPNSQSSDPAAASQAPSLYAIGDPSGLGGSAKSPDTQTAADIQKTQQAATELVDPWHTGQIASPNPQADAQLYYLTSSPEDLIKGIKENAVRAGALSENDTSIDKIFKDDAARQTYQKLLNGEGVNYDELEHMANPGTENVFNDESGKNTPDINLWQQFIDLRPSQAAYKITGTPETVEKLSNFLNLLPGGDGLAAALKSGSLSNDQYAAISDMIDSQSGWLNASKFSDQQFNDLIGFSG